MPMRCGSIAPKKNDVGSAFSASSESMTNMMSAGRLANESASASGVPQVMISCVLLPGCGGAATMKP